jgi:hypothetical protein
MHHPRKGDWRSGQAARGSGTLIGYVDTTIEMDWFGKPEDTDRHRKLTAYSRHPETPRRLVIELNAEGTDYSVCGDLLLDEFEEGWKVLVSVLEEAHNKLTRKQILAAWPEDYPKPDGVTLWRWLELAVRAGRINQAGLGRRNLPFVYWLVGMEQRWGVSCSGRG